MLGHYLHGQHLHFARTTLPKQQSQEVGAIWVELVQRPEKRIDEVVGEEIKDLYAFLHTRPFSIINKLTDHMFLERADHYYFFLSTTELSNIILQGWVSGFYIISNCLQAYIVDVVHAYKICSQMYFFFFSSFFIFQKKSIPSYKMVSVPLACLRTL